MPFFPFSEEAASADANNDCQVTLTIDKTMNVWIVASPAYIDMQNQLEQLASNFQSLQERVNSLERENESLRARLPQRTPSRPAAKKDNKRGPPPAAASAPPKVMRNSSKWRYIKKNHTAICRRASAWAIHQKHLRGDEFMDKFKAWEDGGILTLPQEAEDNRKGFLNALFAHAKNERTKDQKKKKKN